MHACRLWCVGRGRGVREKGREKEVSQRVSLRSNTGGNVDLRVCVPQLYVDTVRRHGMDTQNRNTAKAHSTNTQYGQVPQEGCRSCTEQLATRFHCLRSP
jgi:hypothetical protein